MTRELDGTPPVYHSYLLRLWRESEQGARRASLENVMTSERHSFPNLTSLYAFLQATFPETEGWHYPDESQP
jgi:hypothetical protein